MQPQENCQSDQKSHQESLLLPQKTGSGTEAKEILDWLLQEIRDQEKLSAKKSFEEKTETISAKESQRSQEEIEKTQVTTKISFNLQTKISFTLTYLSNEADASFRVIKSNCFFFQKTLRPKVQKVS